MALLSLLLAAILSAPAAAASPASGAPRPSTPTVAGVAVSGHETFPAEELLKAIAPWEEGVPWTEAGAGAALDKLEVFYRNRGFLDVEVSTRAEVYASSAAWRARVSEGPRYRFGKTRVTGLDRVTEKVVLHERAFEEGDFYGARDLFKTQGRLYATRLFDDVSVRTSTTPAKTVDVWVEVREKKAKWVKAGAGFGSEEKERLSLVFTHRNFLRRAYLLEGSASFSRIWNEYRGEFVNRSLFGTRTEGSLQGSWRRENRLGYDLEQTQGRPSVSRDLGWDVRGTLLFRVARSVAYNVDPDISETTPGKSITGTLGLILGRDTSDDIFSPSRGTRTSLSLERTGGFFGADVHLLKATLDASGYRRLLGSLIGAVRARTGAVRPTGGMAETPVFERFFTGGAGSIRGYRERHVGPLNSLGSPVGGDVVLGASAELRHPIFWRLSGALFVDGGQTGSKLLYAEPSVWKWGGGGGLRLKTPVGPLRADIGYKLNPDPGDRDRWRLHLSLGEAF